MRIVKRVLKILGLGLAGLIALVIIGLVGVKLYLNDERLASFAVGKLNGLFAGRFNVRTVHWALPFHFSLEDISVDDPAGRPAIRATRVDATFDIKALIGGTIAITDIAGHGLDIRIVSMPNAPEDMGLVEAFGPKTPEPEVVDDSPSTIKLRVSGTSITDIEFTYDMPDMRIVLQGGRMENAAFGMHGDKMDIDGHVTVAQGEFKLDPILYNGPIDLTAEGVVMDLGPSGKPSDFVIDAKNVRAGLGGVDVQMQGNVTLPAVDPLPQGTLALKASIPLEHPFVRQYLSGRDRGTVKLDLTMRREGNSTVVSGTADGDNAVVSGIPFDQFGIDATLEKDRVVMRNVSASLDQGSASVSGEVSLNEPMEHDLTVELERFPLQRVLDAVSEGTPAPARLSGRIHANGPGLSELNTHVEGDVRASGLPSDLAGLPDPVHVVLEANVNMQRADIARLTAEGGGARLDASGVVPLDPNGRFDAKLLLTHKQPNATLAAAGQAAPVSIDSLELKAHATGTLANLVADALLDAHGVSAQGVGPADVHVPLHMEGGTATVRDALVTLPAGALHLDASVGVLDGRGQVRTSMPLSAKLAAADVDLEPLTQKHATGRLVLDADVHGTVQAPAGYAHVGVEDLTANGVVFDKADARISMTPERVTLEDLTLDPKDGGKLAARGAYGLNDSKIDATIDIDALPLRSVLVLAAPTVPLSGIVSANIRVAGVVAEPRVEGDLTITELASGTIALGKLSVDFDTQRETVHTVMKLVGPLGTAALDASITPRTQALVAKLDIGDVTLARALAAAEMPLPLDGTFTMTAKADGVLPYPKLEAAIRIEKLLIDGVAPSPDTITLDVNSEPDQSYVAKLAFGEILAADARYWPLRNSADLKARFHELKASAFSPRLQRQGLDLMMSGNTDVHYGGPKSIEGTFTLEAFEAKIQHEMVKLARPTTVRFDGSSVTLPKTDFEGAGSTLSVQGKLDGRAIQADVNGDLNLTVIGPFQNAISDPSGVLRLEAQARGTLDQPLFTGKITVAKEVRGQPRGIPQELDLRSGSITLTPNTVQFDDIAGRLEEGSFKISGEIGLKDLMPDRYNLYLEGKHLAFQTRELRVEADANLKLTGAGKIVPDVSGEIVVVSGRYLKKFALKDFNFIGKQPDTSAPLSQTAPMLGQMNLNIHATNSEDIEIKVDASAFAVTVPLQMDLRVQGTPLSPNIGGKVTAQAGSIKFPEATLNIIETLVTFTPGLPPADGANLTLIAEGEVPSKSDDTSADEVYLVSMSLSGTLASLTFDLSASPGLDRNQTLALLITGKAGFDQLFYGQGTTTGGSSARATALPQRSTLPLRSRAPASRALSPGSSKISSKID